MTSGGETKIHNHGKRESKFFSCFLLFFFFPIFLLVCSLFMKKKRKSYTLSDRPPEDPFRTLKFYSTASVNVGFTVKNTTQEPIDFLATTKPYVGSYPLFTRKSQLKNGLEVKSSLIFVRKIVFDVCIVLAKRKHSPRQPKQSLSIVWKRIFVFFEQYLQVNGKQQTIELFCLWRKKKARCFDVSCCNFDLEGDKYNRRRYVYNHKNTRSNSSLDFNPFFFF